MPLVAARISITQQMYDDLVEGRSCGGFSTEAVILAAVLEAASEQHPWLQRNCRHLYSHHPVMQNQSR